jgi:outer membrane protein assembly factor BamB
MLCAMRCGAAGWRRRTHGPGQGRSLPLPAVLSLVVLACVVPVARADWTTYHADAARSGADQSSGAAEPFAPAWTSPSLGGAIFAEPLVYSGLVIVATENNDVVALSEATGEVIWSAHAGTPVPASALPCGDISPTVGITSTPVIDAARGVLYAVADLWDGSHAGHVLVAYNADTGAELFRRSVDPIGSVAVNQLQRPGLALDGGRVLIGYGGNADDCAAYRGYLVGAPTTNSGPNLQYTTPTSQGDAIWSGGGAPPLDAAGHVYVPTGNGASTDGSSFDHGNTLEKLNAALVELDYWAPASWATDSANDRDLGSVATLLLPDDLAYQGSKNGNGYLLNAASLGHIGGEVYSAPVCDSFGSDVYANGIIYVACADGLRALSLDLGSHTFGKLWAGPASANGPPIIAGGLIWVTAYFNGVLYGLDPQSGAVVVNQQVPAMEHFVTPSASDGKLFLATGEAVEAFTIAAPGPESAPPLRAAQTTSRCANRLTVRLTVPRHSHIVKATVLEGRRRLAVRDGHRLTKIKFIPPAAGSFKLRLVEVTALGHRISRTLTYSDCVRVG